MNEYLVKILKLLKESRGKEKVIVNIREEDYPEVKELIESYIENDGKFSDKWKESLLNKTVLKNASSLYFSIEHDEHFLAMRRSGTHHKSSPLPNEVVFSVGTFFKLKKHHKRKLIL